MLQVLHLKREPFEWVLRHMGHTENVHREYYRQQTDLLEKTKVAKLLLLAESGTIQQFYGKTIDEIELEGN